MVAELATGAFGCLETLDFGTLGLGTLGSFFLGEALGGLLTSAPVSANKASASLLSLAFLEGVEADGGPCTGTPASLDLLQCRLMWRFKLNFVVKALVQDSQLNMQRPGSTGSLFLGLPSFVKLESELSLASLLTFFRENEVIFLSLHGSTVADAGGREDVVTSCCCCDPSTTWSVTMPSSALKPSKNLTALSSSPPSRTSKMSGISLSCICADSWNS